MSNYVKPMVVAADEIAEGVFMASGPTGDVSYTIKRIEDPNEYYPVAKFEITFKNVSNKVLNEAKVTLTVVGDAQTLESGYGMTFTREGNQATLVYKDWDNWEFKPGDSMGPKEFQIRGTGNFDLH